MTYLARDIAARLHHRASYISPQYSDVMADLREIASANLGDQKTQFSARKLEILSSYGFEPVESTKPFAYADGVAIIPIHGLLINRLSWSYSFATGYNFIRSQRLAALADPDVKLIVYDVNSPGGVASGCAELAQEMFDSRDQKPSLSVVDARCYSAALFLASAADRIVVTPSGGCGSIGTVAMHFDYSKMLDDAGMKLTFIFAGDEKVDGNPYESLSARAKATIQRDVDYHYGLFVEAVARHRDISEDEVRATEARIFLPPEAVELGLIDAVETPADAVANFFNQITSDADGGDETMTTKPENAAAPAVPAAVAAAAPAPVLAMSEADLQAAIARGVTAALTAEKTRSAAIKTSEESKGRETLAAHLADNTQMSVEDARAVLAAAPKATATETTKQPSGFADAMNRSANPGIGADGAADAGTGADAPGVAAEAILRDYAGTTGRKVVPIRGAAA